MANPEHIRIVKEGPKVINRWRERQLLLGEPTRLDLRGAKLKKRMLKNANLSHALLQGANLSYSCLKGSDLSFANMNYAELIVTNLRSAICVKANLQSARLIGADLKNAGIESEPGKTLSIHTLRKSCIQNWANELPMNVTKELAGHSSIETTMKYYCQVDEYHRAKAAQVTDELLKKVDV